MALAAGDDRRNRRGAGRSCRFLDLADSRAKVSTITSRRTHASGKSTRQLEITCIAKKH